MSSSSSEGETGSSNSYEFTEGNVAMKEIKTEKKGDQKETKEESKKGDRKESKKKKSWLKKRLSLRSSKKDMGEKPAHSPKMSEELWAKIKEKELYPIQLHFNNIRFSVPPPKGFFDSCKRNKKTEWREILHGITGTFEPGTITGIMGSSGAGKTTLLDVLAGRAKGKIEGDILYNGHPREEAKPILRHQAYVMQADIMLASQTPREILTFAANLRMSKRYTQQQREKRVNELIEELNIGYCQHTQVGSPGLKRGISGGERKRVAIGSELITNPSLLFLDEPTSGLDSETAEHVMEALKVLAQQGRTIICTIHQPNSDIFAKFDNLILLAKGHTIYNGPAIEAVNYFKGIGKPCPTFTNPPDYFMGLIHVDNSDPDSGKQIQHLIDAWAESAENKQLDKVEILEQKLDNEAEKEEARLQQGIFVQAKELVRRNLRDIQRNPLKLRASFGQTLFLSILIGLIYLQIGHGQQDVQSRVGALFFLLLNQTFSAIFGIVNTYHEEKPVFLRENKNHMYGVTPYYLAKIAADLPIQLIFPSVFVIIVYWMVGFKNTAEAFGYSYLAVVLCANIGAAIGLTVGTFASTSSIAIAIAPLVTLPFVLFSGFLINRDSVPPYFIWADYASFFKYALSIVVVKTMEGQKFHCSEDVMLPNGSCPVPDGESVIANYYFDEVSVRDCFLILFGMLIFFRIAAYLVLVRKVATAESNS